MTVAAREQLWRKRPLLRAEDVCGTLRVKKARQVDRAVDKLHAHQLATAGQHHLVEIIPIVVRQMLAASRRVGDRLKRTVRGPDREGERRAEGVAAVKRPP